MKRYFLFSGLQYYPSGGWDDFQGDFDSISEAQDHLDKGDWVCWAHLIDTENGKRIEVGLKEYKNDDVMNPPLPSLKTKINKF